MKKKRKQTKAQLKEQELHEVIQQLDLWRRARIPISLSIWYNYFLRTELLGSILRSGNISTFHAGDGQFNLTFVPEGFEYCSIESKNGHTSIKMVMDTDKPDGLSLALTDELGKVLSEALKDAPVATRKPQ